MFEILLNIDKSFSKREEGEEYVALDNMEENYIEIEEEFDS